MANRKRDRDFNVAACADTAEERQRFRAYAVRRGGRSSAGKTLHAGRFADAIAKALLREFDHTHAAIKKSSH
jgi:chorismate synthase